MEQLSRESLMGEHLGDLITREIESKDKKLIREHGDIIFSAEAGHQKKNQDSFSADFRRLLPRAEWKVWSESCFAQIRANVVIESNRVLKTVFLVTARNVHSLWDEVKRTVSDIGVFYIPSRVFSKNEIPHINEKRNYSITYDCKVGEKYLEQQVLSAPGGALTGKKSIRPVVMGDKLYLPELFWLNKGGDDFLPCLGDQEKLGVSLFLQGPVDRTEVGSIQDLYEVFHRAQINKMRRF
jgi:hypothetical protein